jgi:hypothetical protein
MVSVFEKKSNSTDQIPTVAPKQAQEDLTPPTTANQPQTPSPSQQQQIKQPAQVENHHQNDSPTSSTLNDDDDDDEENSMSMPTTTTTSCEKEETRIKRLRRREKRLLREKEEIEKMELERGARMNQELAVEKKNDENQNKSIVAMIVEDTPTQPPPTPSQSVESNQLHEQLKSPQPSPANNQQKQQPNIKIKILRSQEEKEQFTSQLNVSSVACEINTGAEAVVSKLVVEENKTSVVTANSPKTTNTVVDVVGSEKISSGGGGAEAKGGSEGSGEVKASLKVNLGDMVRNCKSKLGIESVPMPTIAKVSTITPVVNNTGN